MNTIQCIPNKTPLHLHTKNYIRLNYIPDIGVYNAMILSVQSGTYEDKVATIHTQKYETETKSKQQQNYVGSKLEDCYKDDEWTSTRSHLCMNLRHFSNE